MKKMRRMQVWWGWAVPLLLASAAGHASALPPLVMTPDPVVPGPVPVPAPKCTGIDTESGHLSLIWVSDVMTEGFCPTGMTVMYLFSHLGPALAPKNMSVTGSCCPAPAGSLTDAFEFAEQVCPDNSVVTGARMRPGTASAHGLPEFELRCTHIDTHRFLLLPPAAGLSVEYGRRSFLSRLFGLRPAQMTTGWNLVPPQMRYGLGRVSLTQWSTGGCLGFPWGAVLTAINGQDCQEATFRSLAAVPEPAAGR